MKGEGGTVKGERLTVKGDRERGMDKGERKMGTKMPLIVNRSTLTVPR